MHKILIVEDSRTLAKFLVRKLEATIGKVEIDVVDTFADLKSLLEKKHDYTIALLDVYLPDMQDTELIEYVLSYKIPSVVMTGDFDDRLYEKLVKKDIVDFVLKDSAEALEYIVNLTHRLLQNRNTTVMVVDDSPTVLNQISRYLKSQLYHVKTEQNPMQALIDLVNDDSVSIIITDYNMPRMDGVAFLQKLRRMKKKDELGVIGISGDSESAIKFLKYGANDFINKPFNRDEFVHRVNNLAQNLENIRILKEYANQDFLTKVYNRKYFFEAASLYFKEAKKHNKPFAVGMIDIDNFKRINDTYGHDIGDKVIKTLARKLMEKTKGQDLVARFGGEEFCILLKNIPPLAAQYFFEDLCKEIAATKIEADIAHFINFTVSIGVETMPMETLDEMIKEADMNLYEAKESGKNRVVVHLLEHLS
jgi:diguanylate cyclase (GGDEF)-like protein